MTAAGGDVTVTLMTFDKQSSGRRLDVKSKSSACPGFFVGGERPKGEGKSGVGFLGEGRGSNHLPTS